MVSYSKRLYQVNSIISSSIVLNIIPGIIPTGARNVKFLSNCYRNLTRDEIDEIINERDGHIIIRNDQHTDHIMSLERQFELDSKNEKLAHLLHLAKYDNNFNQFADSYSNLYYHTHKPTKGLLFKIKLLS